MWREVFWEEAEAAWEHKAPEVVPVQVQSGCWRSLQSETDWFKRLESPERVGRIRWELKWVLRECEATDFTHIWFLTLPFLWLLSWNRLPKAGWLCGLLLLITEPGTTDRDCVAILQCRWVQLVWFFPVCKGMGGERSKQKALRKQEMEERTAELTEPPSVQAFSLPSAEEQQQHEPAEAESPRFHSTRQTVQHRTPSGVLLLQQPLNLPPCYCI